MDISLREAWEGSRRRKASCPICFGSRVRYSRRRYEGVWLAVLKVRPIRCLDCGVYFPIAVGPVPADVDLVDLHLPFRPSEMDAAADDDRLRVSPLRLVAPTLGARAGRCPDCGSLAVRPARFGAEVSWLRLDAREPYRCIDCNASFSRVSRVRMIVGVSILLALLLGGAFAINSFRIRSGASNASPRIRQNQVPKMPPPVFR